MKPMNGRNANAKVGLRKIKPELADQQGAEAGQRPPRDQREVPVRVTGLLRVGRRGRQVELAAPMAPGAAADESGVASGHGGFAVGWRAVGPDGEAAGAELIPVRKLGDELVTARLADGRGVHVVGLRGVAEVEDDQREVVLAARPRRPSPVTRAGPRLARFHASAVLGEYGGRGRRLGATEAVCW